VLSAQSISVKNLSVDQWSCVIRCDNIFGNALQLANLQFYVSEMDRHLTGAM
jgi:hypothetical protein